MILTLFNWRRCHAIVFNVFLGDHIVAIPSKHIKASFYKLLLVSNADPGPQIAQILFDVVHLLIAVAPPPSNEAAAMTAAAISGEV